MPFDAAGFPPDRPGPARPPRRPGDNLVTILIIVVTVLLLVTPVSLAALVDLVRYVHGP